MVTYENQCCNCADGRSCLGDTCNNRRVRVLICDDCGGEADKLYVLDEKELCSYCALDNLEEV